MIENDCKMCHENLIWKNCIADLEQIWIELQELLEFNAENQKEHIDLGYIQLSYRLSFEWDFKVNILITFWHRIKTLWITLLLRLPPKHGCCCCTWTIQPQWTSRSCRGQKIPQLRVLLWDSSFFTLAKEDWNPLEESE